MDSADGKIGEKGCIFTALWEMKQPHTMTGPCFSGCVLEYGFYLHSMVKSEAVSFIFPLIGSMVGGFYWLFRWNFEK
ncbi:MAG: hypothetical protein KH745_03085 [Bilophila sp.]|nr:hypothetical protein [Bilophila sp.]